MYYYNYDLVLLLNCTEHTIAVLWRVLKKCIKCLQVLKLQPTFPTVPNRTLMLFSQFSSSIIVVRFISLEIQFETET